MPQPSITSFFSATIKSNENDPKSSSKKVNSALQNVSENQENSPVKLNTKKKRVRQISSSESEGENDKAVKGTGVAKEIQQNNGAAEIQPEELLEKDNITSGKSTPKLNGKKKKTKTTNEEIKEESSKIKNTPKTSGRKRKAKSPAENEETTDVKGTPKPTAKKQKTKPNKEESEKGNDTLKSGTKRKAKTPVETEQESSIKKKSSKTKAKKQNAENSELVSKEDKIAEDKVTPKSEKVKDTPKSRTKYKSKSPGETKAKKLVAENSELVSKEDKIADDTHEENAQKMQSPENDGEEGKMEEKTNKKLGGAGLGDWLKKSVKPESKEVNTETSAAKKITKQVKSNDEGMNYDPSKSKYDPVNDACWKEGEKVPYIAMAKTLEVIENISARLKMIEYLRNFFRSVIMLTPDELLPCVYLCLNKVGPAYEGLELGIGEMLLYKTIAQATGRSVDKVKSDVASKGDVGIVAESCRASQQTMFAPPKLTVTTVFKNLKEIAQMSGHSVMSKKIDKISVMLVACRGSEARYLMRSLEGKLRVGLAEQSVLVALSHAAAMCSGSQLSKQELDEHTVALKTAYCECPTYDVIIPVLLKDGIRGVAEQCKLTPGVPLKPMLANPTKGVQEVLERFENVNFTCEYKYDGERAQIHVLESGNICIYSRNQENMTTKYPDIIQRLPQVLGPNVKSCILDSEAVAWDRETKKIRPFQVLSTRKKKNVQESEIKVQVCVFAFDLLYLNGEPLVRKPFIERRKILNESFKQVEGEFMFAKSIDSNQTEEIAEFLEESVKGDCEGLMVKALDVDANYEIAKRSRNWLKLKKDYLEGVGDTLDVVVIAGYHGKGKRSGIYGGFLLACYDDENEEFQTICKIGTGFKDDDFEKHATFFKNHVISEPRSYYRYDSSLQPDVWFEPLQVWEIKCADLTISPVHKAAVGIVDPVSGISLRFPRFLRIRDDKSPEDATSSSQVADLYKNQEQIKNQNKSTTKDDNEDFY